MAYNLYCNQNSQANSAQLFISREKWIFDFNIYILRITAVFGFMYVVGELLEDQLLQKIVCLFIYVLRDRHRLLLHLLNSFHRYIFGHAGPNNSPTLQKYSKSKSQNPSKSYLQLLFFTKKSRKTYSSETSKAFSVFKAKRLSKSNRRFHACTQFKKAREIQKSKNNF